MLICDKHANSTNSIYSFRPRNAGVVTTYASWFATNLDRLYNGKNTMVCESFFVLISNFTPWVCQVQLSDTQYVPIMMSDPQLIEVGSNQTFFMNCVMSYTNQEQNNNTIDCSHCKEISANEVSIGEINGPEYKVSSVTQIIDPSSSISTS